MLREMDGLWPVEDTAEHASIARRCGSFADARHVAYALKPDHPVFCYSKEMLASAARTFTQRFPGRVTYAVKANPSAAVVETLRDCGIDGYDVASPAEMDLVRRTVPDATLHYHNPIKSRREIADAHAHYGVRDFAVDDEAELDKIAEAIDTRHDTELCIRFRLPVSRAECDFSSKFGADVDGAVRLLAKAQRRGFKAGLTFHPGSQCLDPLGYVEHIRAAGDIARNAGIAIATLNVGGGFPAPYAGTELPPLERYFDAIRDAAAEAFPHRPPRLVAEPGRALVSTCTSILTRVKHVRPGPGEIYLNDGIYGAFMELTQFDVSLPYRVIAAGGRTLGATEAAFTAYGPTCDPVDRLPGTLTLPTDIRHGDWIEFGMVGAYGAATVTRFNGYGTVDTVPVACVLTA